MDAFITDVVIVHQGDMRRGASYRHGRMPGDWISRLGGPPSHSGMTEADLKCSFCGKHRDAVRALVAGPTPAVAICNECIELCTEIVDEPDPGTAA